MSFRCNVLIVHVVTAQRGAGAGVCALGESGGNWPQGFKFRCRAVLQTVLTARAAKVYFIDGAVW